MNINKESLNMNINKESLKMSYLEECTKYFAPLDEIVEALHNKEGVSGLTYKELLSIIVGNKALNNDIAFYCLENGYNLED